MFQSSALVHISALDGVDGSHWITPAQAFDPRPSDGSSLVQGSFPSISHTLEKTPIFVTSVNKYMFMDG